MKKVSNYLEESGSLFKDIIFGPVKSRRLGNSLGINLLPLDFKFCTFNCVYCECGWTKHNSIGQSKFVHKDIIKECLEKKLIELKDQKISPNSFTFAGNGEPTLHPDFAAIIDETILLRDKYFPYASISVLSNSSLINRPFVFEALSKVDHNILKLDTGSPEMLKLINKPKSSIGFHEIINGLKKFNGNLILQTLFFKGKHEGQIINNTGGEEFNLLLKYYKEINPKYVMVYSIDRIPPSKDLEKISIDDLNLIAEKIKTIGVEVKVY